MSREGYSMRKLNIELVPDGCWYSNLRSALPPKLWEIIKKDAKTITDFVYEDFELVDYDPYPPIKGAVSV